MILSLLLLILLFAVAFFHYTQGFFSAAISTILVAVAAIIAITYHEQFAAFLMQAKIYDASASISIAVLFAVAYIIPRVVIDYLVPGNIRLPAIVDKVGAGIMGVIAGLLATGVVAVAADALPFGTSIGGYTRFDVADQQSEYMGQTGQYQDTTLNDVLTTPTLDANAPSKDHLWFRQDDAVIGLVNKVSDGGSLAGTEAFDAVHPDYLDELFGQRLGIQVGAKHTLQDTGQGNVLRVEGVYTQPKLSQVDSEPSTLRGNGVAPPPALLEPDPGQSILIVRTVIAGGKVAGDDSDSLFRFSPGSVHLVAGQPDHDAPFKDYYPVATLDPKGVAVASHPDDYLISDLSGPRTIDFVFVVDNAEAFAGDATHPPYTMTSGAFIDIKRYGIVDLSGKKVDLGPAPNPDQNSVLRPQGVADSIKHVEPIPLEMSKSVAAQSQAHAQAVAGTVLGSLGLVYQGVEVSDQLFAPIDVHSGNAEGQAQLSTGVTGNYQFRQWQKLSVPPDASLKELASPGNDLISTLFVYPGRVLVQFHTTVSTTNPDKVWAWARQLSNLALTDSAGHSYKVNGAFAKVQVGAQDRMVANYRNTDFSDNLQPLQAGQGRPTDVWITFEVPERTNLQDLLLNGTAVLQGLDFIAMPSAHSATPAPSQSPRRGGAAGTNGGSEGGTMNEVRQRMHTLPTY